MIVNIFYILGNVLNIYMWICIICIFLSWMPHLLANPIGRFIFDACEPYLSYFRRFKFARLANLDFSPVIALGVLSILKNICFSIYMQGRFSIIGLIIILLSSLWQVLSFLVNMVLLLALMRFVLEFSYKYRSSIFCLFIDNIFRPFRNFIMKYVFRFDWKKEKFVSLIIFIFFLVIKLSMWFSFNYSISILQKLLIFHL